MQRLKYAWRPRPHTTFPERARIQMAEVRLCGTIPSEFTLQDFAAGVVLVVRHHDRNRRLLA